jgi:hypothetical protein
MFVNSGHDTYYCSARQADKTACSQRPIKRTLLDDAVRDYFAEIALDIDATRRQVTDALDRPHARAVVGIDEEMVPVLARTPLHTQGQSDHVALPT